MPKKSPNRREEANEITSHHWNRFLKWIWPGRRVNCLLNSRMAGVSSMERADIATRKPPQKIVEVHDVFYPAVRTAKLSILSTHSLSVQQCSSMGVGVLLFYVSQKDFDSV
jgi:hypothetical protein